jgi:hypothetical protein
VCVIFPLYIRILIGHSGINEVRTSNFSGLEVGTLISIDKSL